MASWPLLILPASVSLEPHRHLMTAKALPCSACLVNNRPALADKLTTSVRYGSVGDIQVNLERADKTQLVGRDSDGASLLMHAAQRGETAVFAAVLNFLSEKLAATEVSEKL